MEANFPVLRQIALDSTNARRLAEFYRELLGYQYRAGDEPPAPGADDPNARDWLVLVHPSGAPLIAFQPVAELPPSTWPEAGIPQQLHLDLTVADEPSLRAQHERALALGARLIVDNADDPDEPIFIYADPDGHPFCIYVARADDG